jgi:DDE superfamily endonuclease
MPKLLAARPPRDPQEEHQVRHVARSQQAPADWVGPAQMIVRSWDGLRSGASAAEVACHPHTVRERFRACNERGRNGLGMQPGSGRKPRLTAAQRRAGAAREPPARSAGDLPRWHSGPGGRGGRRRVGVVARCVGGPSARQPAWPQPGAPHPASGRRALATPPHLGAQQRPGRRPTRTAVVACCTAPAEGATTLGLDERGPVVPRTFPPAPGWSPNGHRIKAPMDDGRGLKQVWVYGALRVRDGHEVTVTAPSRHTVGYRQRLTRRDEANPEGALKLVSDNLSRPTSGPIQQWLAQHPRVHPVPLPTGACWLNVQEGWWRLVRREACAGQSFADAKESDLATRVATAHLNARAHPWVWGRPPPPHRTLRRRFVYYF